MIWDAIDRVEGLMEVVQRSLLESIRPQEPEMLYSGMENPALRGNYITTPLPVVKNKRLSLKGENVSAVYVSFFSMSLCR